MSGGEAEPNAEGGANAADAARAGNPLIQAHVISAKRKPNRAGFGGLRPPRRRAAGRSLRTLVRSGLWGPTLSRFGAKEPRPSLRQAYRRHLLANQRKPIAQRLWLADIPGTTIGIVASCSVLPASCLGHNVVKPFPRSSLASLGETIFPGTSDTAKTPLNHRRTVILPRRKVPLSAAGRP